MWPNNFYWQFNKWFLLLSLPSTSVVKVRKIYIIYKHIVTCQAHPVLVKKGESEMRFVPFKIFHLGGYLACLLLSV